MFKKKDFADVEGFDTLIGANTTFEGNIVSDGTIRVDGKVKGDLNVNGDVFVGSSAVITGNLYANNVHLSGIVEGNINSKGILRLLTTAKLYGDIQVHSFVADEGAVFQGKCNMVEVPQTENTIEKASSKKGHSNKDYKKSTVISQLYEEKEKAGELKE